MANILVLFAHPALEKSRIHTRLIKHIKHVQGVTFHDLYEAYPDFDINVKKEQYLLMLHDIVIWQHPFYWYSAPALTKQWMDLVLEHGWAYGAKGKALMGKKIFNVISTGGTPTAYTKTGRNRFTIRELLAPFDQTANLCNMTYLPPFVIQGTHKLQPADIELFGVQYEQLLTAMAHDRIADHEWKNVTYLNDLVPIPQHIQS
jgi:glutathione-regulated potassium-efflux system ancillary protein KefG